MGGEPLQAAPAGGGRIAAHTAAMTASRVVAMLLGLVQVSLVVQAIGQEDFGRYSFALGFTSLFTVFATLGVQRVVIRNTAADPASGWRQLWAAETLVTVLSGLVYGAIVLSMLLIEDHPMRRQAVYMAGLWVVVLWALQRPIEGLLMARDRMLAVSALHVAAAAIKVAAVYLALRHTPTSAAAHAAAAAGTGAGLALFLCLLLGSESKWRPDLSWPLLRAQVRACRPLLAAMIFSLIYFKSDLTLLAYLAGDAAVALYGLPQRIMEPIMMLSGVVGAALFPVLCRFAAHSEADFDRLRTTTLRLTVLIALPMGAGLAVLADPLVRLMSGAQYADFAGSTVLLQGLCVVTPLFYFNGLAMEVLYARHENWFVVRLYGAAALGSVALNCALIPTLGASGAVLTAIAVNTAISAAYAWKLRGLFGPLAFSRMLPRALAACGAMAGTVYAVVAWTHPVLGVAAGVSVYPALLWVFGALNDDERRLIRNILRQAPRGLGR